MLEVANLIAVVGGDTTAHEVRQRPDAITVALRVTTRIRSFTRVTLMLRWMGLGLRKAKMLLGLDVLDSRSMCLLPMVRNWIILSV